MLRHFHFRDTGKDGTDRWADGQTKYNLTVVGILKARLQKTNDAWSKMINID